MSTLNIGSEVLPTNAKGFTFIVTEIITSMESRGYIDKNLNWFYFQSTRSMVYKGITYRVKFAKY